MPCRVGDRVRPDEALEARPAARALRPRRRRAGSAGRARTTATPLAARRLQAVEHRRLEGVVAAADVLQVDDQRVEAAELLRRSAAELSTVVAVETVNAKAAGGRRRRRRSGPGRLPREAVLRAEERRESNARRRREQIGRVAQLRIDRRGVADQPDAPAAQRLPVGIAENVEAGSHDGHGLSDEMVRCAMPPRSFGIEQRCSHAV